MCIDSLEVEDNLRMSKKILDKYSGDKIENELQLEEQHGKETFSSHSNPSFFEKEYDHPSNVQEECYNDLF